MPDLPPRLLLPVLANPADDEPRLIAADWWDEHGEPERAEFVRVQFRLAELVRIQDEFSKADVSHLDAQRVPADRELDALRCREDALLGAGFRGGWNDFPCGLLAWWWGRGFLRAVRARWEKWERHGPLVVQNHPVEEVQLAGVRPFFRLPDRKPFWFRIGTDPATGTLPGALYDLLEGYELDNGVCRCYPTEAAALRALSDAAVLWAKRRAWPCGLCKATGKVPWQWPPCPDCGGRGWRIENL